MLNETAQKRLEYQHELHHSHLFSIVVDQGTVKVIVGRVYLSLQAWYTLVGIVKC